MTRFLSLACLAALACAPAEDSKPTGPVLQSREVTYQSGTTNLRGYVAWDSMQAAKRPGILVVHEWWGHNKHARDQATRLAAAGYVGFALDMYGDGKSTTHPDSANAFMMRAVQDQPQMVARFRAALEQLKADPHVDASRVAAIGYCFGGMVVLSMARAGEPLGAVASFHGAIPPTVKVDSGTVKARILIMTGADDPMVPMAQVDSFAQAMKAAGATVEVVSYPHAMHGFTNPRADSVGMQGLRYDPEADRASWAALLKELAAVFP